MENKGKAMTVAPIKVLPLHLSGRSKKTN